MIDKEIQRKLLEVKDLPTLPEVMQKILQTLDDEGSSAADLTNLLERDHSISARVLRLSNSAFYGLRSKVDSIRRGIVVLGFDAIRQLALATSVLDSFSKHRQLALDPEDFWLHSLGTAKASQLLAQRCTGIESPEGCFSAGLLHDIGKYVLALVLEEQYTQIAQQTKDSLGLLKDLEARELKTTHAEVGGWLAEKWRFPPIITQVIRGMYDPPSRAGSCQTEIAIISLGNEIARVSGLGHGGDFKEHPYVQESLKLLGLTRTDMDKVIEELSPLRDEMIEFLHLARQEA